MARLAAYRSKRNFDVTAEPRGAREHKTKSRRFVIQRHDATRLHYDLRLELDGVYKSWAVTKTPSPDPQVKRLAVEVEDHPLEYGTFEGTIPQGEYGGGTVQLWDRGSWTPQSASDPLKDLEKGHLKVTFDGERMQGGWALIRLRDDKAKSPRRKTRHNWLLIKERDDAVDDADALAKEVTSVKSGRTLEQIAKSSRSVWHSNKAAQTEKRAAAKPAKKPASKKKKRARA
ncbi:MAG TPA: DNA polymerase ligase N-terminal domain-containing protein [Rhizomicrobium sp.]|jgi:bifunctional non-homologous end joining protein LigD|nr:DNA polymerase ligase N-terminal domain-containing protein [Rhizomicrobium sp.]